MTNSNGWKNSFKGHCSVSPRLQDAGAVLAPALAQALVQAKAQAPVLAMSEVYIGICVRFSFKFWRPAVHGPFLWPCAWAKIAKIAFNLCCGAVRISHIFKQDRTLLRSCARGNVSPSLPSWR